MLANNQKVSDKKVILSLSWEFAIRVFYNTCWLNDFQIWSIFQLCLDKKSSHMETGLYFITTISTNHLAINTFQFVDNSALSAELSRCQKSIDYFNKTTSTVSEF